MYLPMQKERENEREHQRVRDINRKNELKLKNQLLKYKMDAMYFP